MDIISCFNPPRLCFLDGKDIWVRGLTIGDFAFVLAWLDDWLPGKEARIIPPRFLSSEAQEAIETPLGRCVLMWSSVRHSGVTWEQCQRLLPLQDSQEWARIVAVLFRRRKTLKASGTGQDIGEAWWGRTVEGLCTMLGITIDQVADLSLDQIACLGRKGLEEENPGVISWEDMQHRWEESKKAATNGSAN